ncbi:MAG: hypothetical protein GMKNLPBB_00318 [Myxococcota bacterium]|nr:hypothetical protein [Myxococcota bacterium]
MRNETMWVNVRDHGAHGDGEADDTPAFRKALDATPDGGVLYIPPCKAFYRLRLDYPHGGNLLKESFLLHRRKSLTIRGDGYASFLKGVIGKTGQPVVAEAVIAGHDCDRIRITGLRIEGWSPGKGYFDGVGVHIRGCRDWIVDHCWFTGDGRETGGTWAIGGHRYPDNKGQVLNERVTFDSNSVVGMRQGMSGINFCHHLRVIYNQARALRGDPDGKQNGAHCTKIEYSDDVLIHGNHIEYGHEDAQVEGATAFSVWRGPGDSGAPARRWIITNNVVVRQGPSNGKGVIVGGKVEDVIIANNAIHGCRIGVQITQVTSRNVMITGNAISGFNQYGVLLDRPSGHGNEGVSVLGNSIRCAEANHDPALAGIYGKFARGALISGNLLWGPEEPSSAYSAGIRISQCRDILVQGNHIRGQWGRAVHLPGEAESVDNVILGNLAVNPAREPLGTGFDAVSSAAGDRSAAHVNHAHGAWKTPFRLGGPSLHAELNTAAPPVPVLEASERPVLPENSATALFLLPDPGEGKTPVRFLEGGRPGMVIHLQATARIKIEKSPALRLKSPHAFEMSPGDTLTLAMFEPGVWTELSRTMV